MKFKALNKIKKGDRIIIQNKYGLRIVVKVLEVLKEKVIIEEIVYKKIKVEFWTGKEFYTTTKAIIDAL